MFLASLLTDLLHFDQGQRQRYENADIVFHGNYTAYSLTAVFQFHGVGRGTLAATCTADFLVIITAIKQACSSLWTNTQVFTDSSSSSCAAAPSHHRCLATTDELLPSLQSQTPATPGNCKHSSSQTGRLNRKDGT